MIVRRLALGLLASGATGAAHAQLSPQNMLGDRPARSSDYSLVARVQHETNLAHTSKANAALQNVVPEDTYVEPTLTVDFLQPIGRQAVFLRGLGSYLFHDRNKTLDHTHFDFSGGLGTVIGPCGSVYSGGYFRGTNEVNGAALSTTVRNIQSVIRANAMISCARPTGIGVNLDASYISATNSLKAATSGDYQTASVDAGLAYQRPAFGSLSLIASYTKTDYSHHGPSALGPAGYESRAVSLRAERRLGARINASATVGYNHTDLSSPRVNTAAANGALSNYSGLTYSGDVSFRATSRLVTTLAFERAVQPTQIAGGSYQVSTNLTGNVNYSLGSRIQLGLTGEQKRTNVRGDIPVSALTLTNNRVRTAEVRATYRLGRRVSFVLSGEHQEQRSDNVLNNFNDNIVGLSTAVRF
jgi:hypothetical protein